MSSEGQGGRKPRAWNQHLAKSIDFFYCFITRLLSSLQWWRRRESKNFHSNCTEKPFRISVKLAAGPPKLHIVRTFPAHKCRLLAIAAPWRASDRVRCLPLAGRELGHRTAPRCPKTPSRELPLPEKGSVNTLFRAVPCYALRCATGCSIVFDTVKRLRNTGAYRYDNECRTALFQR